MAAAFCLLHGFCSQFPHRLWMYILFIDGDRGTSENRPDPFFASLHVIVFVSFVSCSLSLSLHTYLWIGGLCTSRLAEPTSTSHLSRTNSFRAHDECNNHCPPTSLPPPPPPPPPPIHRPTDPTLRYLTQTRETQPWSSTRPISRNERAPVRIHPAHLPTLPYPTTLEWRDDDDVCESED